MAYEHKEGRFSLFPNDKKQTEKDPDYTGNGMINGEIRKFWAYVSQTNDGRQYLSCICLSKTAQKERQEREPGYRPPPLATNRLQNPPPVAPPAAPPARPANPFFKPGFKPPAAAPAAQQGYGAADDVPF